MDRITTTDHTHHIFPHKAPTAKLNPAPSALRPSKVKVTFSQQQNMSTEGHQLENQILIHKGDTFRLI
jgi:hypothetical protein